MKIVKKRNVLLILGLLTITIELLGLAIIPSFSAPPAYVLPDAYVSADQINGSGYGSDFTNSTGQYFIDEGIRAGNYSVQFSADGYLRKRVNTTVASTNETQTIDVILSRSALVWGKVKGFDGRPVIGVEVNLYENGSGSYVDNAMTDSEGMYYFATEIDTGTYYMKVQEFTFPYPGYPHLYVPLLENGYVSGKISEVVSVTAGSTAMVPDVVLDQSGAITGTVTDDHGNPMAYASVRALNLDTFDSTMVGADANGVYRIAYDIFNGTYSVEPSVFGYLADSADVATVQGTTVVQNFTMVKSATVRGSVLRKSDSRPIPGTTISLMSDPYKYYGGATTRANGTYEANYGLGTANYTAIVYLGTEMMNMTMITLATGENLTLDFWIDAYFISGTVYNSTLGGPTVGYPNVYLSFGDYFGPPGGSASGSKNGTYEMIVPVREGTSGLDYAGTFTVSAWGFNTTEVNSTVTIGNDIIDMDFVLFPEPAEPPPPPSAIIRGMVHGGAGPSLPFSHQIWEITSGNYTFTVGFNTSSSISYVYSSVTSGTVSLYLWGPEGTTGQLTAWIPKDLFPGPTFTVASYPGPNPTPTLTSNETHWIVTIDYSHSSRAITFQSENAIPEYPGPMILIAAFASGTAVVLLERKRRMRVLSQ